MTSKTKKSIRNNRKKRITARILATASRLRLCAFRSNQHIYAQIIETEKGKTLISASDLELEKKDKAKKGPREKKTMGRKEDIAFRVGELIAEKALKNKIQEIVFDRRSYKYHGRIRALAEGARKGGLKF